LSRSVSGGEILNEARSVGYLPDKKIETTDDVQSSTPISTGSTPHPLLTMRKASLIIKDYAGLLVTPSGLCPFGAVRTPPATVPAADAEIHLLDTGHFALEDQGDEIAALIRDFLDRKLSRR